MFPVGRIAKKQSEGVFVNSAQNYSAILSKINSYRLLFRGFCPLSQMQLRLLVIWKTKQKLTLRTETVHQFLSQKHEINPEKFIPPLNVLYFCFFFIRGHLQLTNALISKLTTIGKSNLFDMEKLTYDAGETMKLYCVYRTQETHTTT